MLPVSRPGGDCHFRQGHQRTTTCRGLKGGAEAQDRCWREAEEAASKGQGLGFEERAFITGQACYCFGAVSSCLSLSIKVLLISMWLYCRELARSQGGRTPEGKESDWPGRGLWSRAGRWGWRRRKKGPWKHKISKRVINSDHCSNLFRFSRIL